MVVGTVDRQTTTQETVLNRIVARDVVAEAEDEAVEGMVGDVVVGDDVQVTGAMKEVTIARPI